MEFFYCKNDNKYLFSKLNENELMNIENLQNFIPIYRNFFNLNTQNFNKINLNSKFALCDLDIKKTENRFCGTITSQSGLKQNVDMFFKISPLLDTLKYMTGKYDASNSSLLKLPGMIPETHSKLQDPNNSAYIDGFFTYLTSTMLHKYNFVHGTDYFGSFLGIKNNFYIEISDDIDFLYESSYFQKNLNNLFTMDSDIQNKIFNIDSRNNRPSLIVLSDEKIILDDIECVPIDNEDTATNNLEVSTNEITSIYEGKKQTRDNNTDSLSSKCSSCSSKTSTEEDDECDSSSDNDANDDTIDNAVREQIEKEIGKESQEDNESQYSSSGSLSEMQINVCIKKFPVQITAIEMCQATMDDLLMNNRLTEDEFSSFIIQILMILITYQKAFDLTHNDLHTNNVMFVTTKEKYLYYKYDSITYKIPTYGRIVKIIDFGRAVYKFRNNLMCSDSYHHKGDAATQYNFEPYFNPKKKRIEPNSSFDLCRLGSALYDIVVEEYKDYGLTKIIKNWCLDDKGRSVLYKKNGEERYPDFKLYKMIARTVHNHTPQRVIKLQYFSRYIYSDKVSNDENIMDIDSIPSHQ